MVDSVVIRINGDIKDYTAKLDAVQKQTEDLSKALNKTGLASAATFAVTAAGAVKATLAYKDSIKPALELNGILKAQGIFSEKLVNEYSDIAKELKAITGVDDEVTTSGQAVIQRFIGQTKVTKELTAAILDFAAGAKIDTVTAFNLVARSLGTSQNALAKYGIELSENLTVQEKMSVFIANTNSKFRDQAKNLNEAAGPLARLGDAYGNVIENVGQRFEPVVDKVASGLERLANTASENETLGNIVASIAIGIGAMAGGVTILASVSSAFVALTAAATAAGISIGVATGGLTLLAGAAAAVGFAVLNANKQLESLDVLTQKLAKSQAELNELRKKDITGFGVAREISMKTDEIKILERQIKQVKALTEEKEKAATVQQESDAKAKIAADELNKIAEARKKKEDDRLKSIEDEKKEREALSKSLIDAGKTELQALEDLMQRRLQLAGKDANLRLLIEKDYQAKKMELEEKNIEKLKELRQGQYDYEEKLRKESEAMQLNLIQAGANGIVGGKKGAENLITTGATTALDAYAPGAGQALSPIIGALAAQGPNAEANYAAGKERVSAAQAIVDELKKQQEAAAGLTGEDGRRKQEQIAKELSKASEELNTATGALSQMPVPIRDTIKEFASSIPDIIAGIIEALPIVIEELANQAPVIIDKLIEKLPDFIGALVRAAPKIIAAQVAMAPKIIMAIIQDIPQLVKSFIDGLIYGAGDFVNALIDAINPFSSGEGGFVDSAGNFIEGAVSTVGDILGFAEGGSASVRRVPSGFSGDRFPAFLSSDELVVKPDVARDLESFLNNQGMSSGGNLREIQLLTQILDAVRSPMTIDAPIEMEGQKLANALLKVSRNFLRTGFN